MRSSLGEAGELLASAFDEFLEQYAALRIKGGPVTPRSDRVEVHPSMLQCFWAAGEVIVEILERTPAGTRFRDFLAQYVACCPASVLFKKEFQAHAENLNSRHPGGIMDYSCKRIAELLARGLERTSISDTLSRRQRVFHFPPKQRLLLEALHGRGWLSVRRVMEQVYPSHRGRRVPSVRSQNRLRKLFRDTNQNLASLSLSLIVRKISRRQASESAFSWPHQGPIP